MSHVAKLLLFRPSSQSFPAAQRDIQRLSFKTALRITFPWGSSDTPGDSWDGSSTPKPVPGDGYFGSLTATPPTPQSLSRLSPRSTPTLRSAGGLSFTPRPGACLDPPRPPKEGFEWVWFPEGYWAEREIVLKTFRKSSSGKRWRWTNKSGGIRHSVASEPEPQLTDINMSPKTALGSTGPLSPSSEEALVLSLQRLPARVLRSSKNHIPSISQTLGVSKTYVEELQITLEPPAPPAPEPLLEPPCRGESAVESSNGTARNRKGIKLLPLFKSKTVSVMAV